MDVPGLSESILAPARLLVREARHWLPTVAVLAMFSALPEVLLQTYAPDALALAGGWMNLDLDFLVASLGALAILWALKLVVELLAYMLVFVVLADLTAGRTPSLAAGLRRLASWRLQGVWILAGLFEQAAIDLWFLGGGFLLVPFGLVTVAAYEEDSGLKAFSRSVELGAMEMGSTKPGVRVAIAVTVGFAVGFVVSSLVSVASCAFSSADYGSPLLALLGFSTADGFTLPVYTWKDAAVTVLLAPFGMIPTVYMMATQQTVYWQARRHDEARLAAAGTPAPLR